MRPSILMTTLCNDCATRELNCSRELLSSAQPRARTCAATFDSVASENVTRAVDLGPNMLSTCSSYNK